MNVQTLFVNAAIYTHDRVIRNGRMIVNTDGTLGAIGGEEITAPEQAVVIDVQGRNVLPGLIDVHIHGGGGYDILAGTYEDLEGTSVFHAQHGTTAFLATTGAEPKEHITKMLQSAAAAMNKGVSGAQVAGIHLEGPFINEKRKGAMNAAEIRPHNIEELQHYIEASEHHIRLVTLAPETAGGAEAVKLLVERGITVSIGHSDATYTEVLEAVALGASHTTHHFNGMRPLHHREPGVAGAGLILPQLTTELIADGIHVHPAAVKLLFEMKTPENVCVITDAVSYGGLSDGEYDTVRVCNGEVYLKGTDTLAGSTLTMIQALKNVIKFTGYALEKVLPSLTLVPARQIRCDDRKGSLKQGKDADFIIVDEHLSVHATYVGGREVYRAER